MKRKSQPRGARTTAKAQARTASPAPGKRTPTTGLGRRPTQPQPTAAPPKPRVLLLDYEAGRMVFLEATALHEAPLASLRRGRPHPLTVQVFAHKGYRIAEVCGADELRLAAALDKRLKAALALLDSAALLGMPADGAALRAALTGTGTP